MDVLAWDFKLIKPLEDLVGKQFMIREVL